ncbi:MAG: alpha-amylase family glycosyl hydrolase, partial [Eubacteriales bacterium]
MKSISLNSKIKDLLEHPVGKDIVRLLVEQVPGVNMDTVRSPLVSNIKLSALPTVSRGMVKKELLNTFVEKLNLYAHETIPPERPTTEKWWKGATVYQIYPRSFCDSNGDGIGDLAGITSKLDYLKDLGVDMLWMSPINQSPNDDNGYDISDYYAIMDEFGTMEDFDRLISEAHKRGIKVMMDMVLNHSSDEHEWFKQALADKESPYRDYYYFEKGKDGGPPNNWTSIFRGPAWVKDEKHDEWYLHLFTKKQCDLNWECERMRKDLYAMMRFWLDKGVDGFRYDVITFIAKAEGLPDGSDLLYQMMGYRGVEHFAFTPKVHEYLAEMHREVLAGRDCVTVGEGPGVGLETGKLFTHEDRKELDMLFCFDALESNGHSKFDDYVYDLNRLKTHHIYHQTENSKNSW